MAKWGEGDPRWICEERPDATNVNNWHWTEKNADAWSKKKLGELLLNFEPLEASEADLGHVIIDEVEKCEGEARANNRKAKLIFFYEWDIVLKWTARRNDETVEGKISVPNLSEEHVDINDVDVDVSLTSSASSWGSAVKESLRKGIGARRIRERLQSYVDALKSEFSQGLILPPAGSASTSVTKAPVVANKTAVVASAINSASATEALQKLGVGASKTIAVESIVHEERFKCTGQELYNVLTQREMLQAFTAAAVNMKEVAVNEPFEILNGNIQGRWMQLQPFTKIVQKWRLRSWPTEHFSTVEFTINQSSDDTKLKLKQTQVPVKEVECTKQGWNRYYFEPIRKTFGFGMNIF